MYFSPHSNSLHACWHCTHFQALIYQDTAAKCALPPGIRSMPDRGCAFWEREVGSDDEPGPPRLMSSDTTLSTTVAVVSIACAP